MTEQKGSLLGYPLIVEMVFIYLLLFTLTLPISFGIILFRDYHSDELSPKQWTTVTVIDKHNHYYNQVVTKEGVSSSGFKYRIKCQGENLLSYTLEGDAYEYGCIVEGAKLSVLIKGQRIIDMKLIDEIT